jgi:hypothetical protein
MGIPLLTGWLRLNGRRALIRGSVRFLAGLAAMALSPWYSLAFVLLPIGGLGTAPRPTTARMIPPARRSIGLNSAHASKTLPISRGTGSSNPFPSSGESANSRSQRDQRYLGGVSTVMPLASA